MELLSSWCLGDLVKHMKFDFLEFKDSLLALNQAETSRSSVFVEVIRVLKSGADETIVVLSAKRIKENNEEE